MPLALARKYRPKSFAAIAAQSHVANTLKGAIAHQRIAHGYLLCGPRGTGKTTIARVLAMALNCERRAERVDGEPCGECESCRRIWTGGTSLDVVEIDAASNRGVDDARELRERAMYAPSTDDRYKVYIVDEAHMLTREAWNALLKILEEPPPRVVFVFATTEPQKIAQTAAPVLSRLQRFDLKRIGTAEIRQRLLEVLRAENIAAESEAIAMLAHAADGSMRDALSLADQVLALDDAAAVTPARVRAALGLVAESEYLAILDLIAEHRAADVFATVSRLADAGIDFSTFLAGLADLMRAQLAVVLGAEPSELSEPTRSALASRRGEWSPADLLRMLSAITELEPRFRKSGQQQLLLETLLLRCALIDRTVALEDLLKEFDPPAARTGPSGAPPAPASRRADRLPSTDPEPPAPSGEPSAEPPAKSRARESAPGPEGHAESGQAVAARLAERWPVVVGQLRRERAAPMLVIALEQSAAELGPSPDEITLRLGERNDILARALDAGRSEILAAIRQEWPRIGSLRVVQPAHGATLAVPQRLTAEAAKADQVASLRKRDAVLGAAIDALDLELIE